jgi:hypothetical protein
MWKIEYTKRFLKELSDANVLLIVKIYIEYFHKCHIITLFSRQHTAAVDLGLYLIVP